MHQGPAKERVELDGDVESRIGFSGSGTLLGAGYGDVARRGRRKHVGVSQAWRTMAKDEVRQGKMVPP